MVQILNLSPITSHLRDYLIYMVYSTVYRTNVLIYDISFSVILSYDFSIYMPYWRNMKGGWGDYLMAKNSYTYV